MDKTTPDQARPDQLGPPPGWAWLIPGLVPGDLLLAPRVLLLFTIILYIIIVVYMFVPNKTNQQIIDVIKVNTLCWALVLRAETGSVLIVWRKTIRQSWFYYCNVLLVYSRSSRITATSKNRFSK